MTAGAPAAAAAAADGSGSIEGGDLDAVRWPSRGEQRNWEGGREGESDIVGVWRHCRQ